MRQPCKRKLMRWANNRPSKIQSKEELVNQPALFVLVQIRTLLSNLNLRLKAALNFVKLNYDASFST